MRSMISSHTTCTERARSISRCVSFVSGYARRTAEQLVEGAVGHRQAGEVVEIFLVQREGAVFAQVDQLAEESGRRNLGSPYGARPMTLYSPELTLKPV